MMPPNRPLNLQQRTLIKLWIEQGAKNTTCTSVVDTSNIVDTNKTGIIDTILNQLDTICFIQDVQPIFLTNCAISGCHDNITREKGFDFSSYLGIVGPSGLIVPYVSGESEIYSIISEGEMPPEGKKKLSVDQITTIRKWIEEGALNSDCPNFPCGKDTVSFAIDVWPVINDHCVGCHNTDEANYNINLESYTHIVNVANTMKNEESQLVGAIRHDPGFFPMPQVGELDDCTINNIVKWVEQGAPNN